METQKPGNMHTIPDFTGVIIIIIKIQQDMQVITNMKKHLKCEGVIKESTLLCILLGGSSQNGALSGRYLRIFEAGGTPKQNQTVVGGLVNEKKPLIINRRQFVATLYRDSQHQGRL